MKPLLRTLVIVDAVIVLVGGLFFIVTPWIGGLYAPLAPLQTTPAVNGQLYGVALIGLAWLLAHAVVDGVLTAPVAKVGGHITWISGLVLLVWLVARHTPVLGGIGQVAGPGVGIGLLVIGLAQARLAMAVRRRERLLVAGAASAARAEARARAAPIPVATEGYASVMPLYHGTRERPEDRTEPTPYSDSDSDSDEPRLPPRM